jgi:hypothetical protein
VFERFYHSFIVKRKIQILILAKISISSIYSIRAEIGDEGIGGLGSGLAELVNLKALRIDISYLYFYIFLLILLLNFTVKN